MPESLMSFPRADAPRQLPTWLVVLGSAVVVVHLGAVAAVALAAQSGPWLTRIGPTPVEPPQFAAHVGRRVAPSYLRPLKLAHDYHFVGNRPAWPDVSFEVRLKDDEGNLLETVRVPEAGANFWVRHREQLLARALAEDLFVEPPGPETIPAPGQEVPRITIWDPDRSARNLLRLTPTEVHLIPRDRQVMRPSELSMILARSYVRHLCRTRGAARGELLRHTREPVYPHVLVLPDAPLVFDDLVCNFGEFSR
jgi:hypothetical protein